MTILVVDEKQNVGFAFLLLGVIFALAPSQFEAMFVSYAHSREDIDRTCETIKKYKDN